MPATGHGEENPGEMKIIDLKCTVIGNHPVVRITTDEGIDGYGQAEGSKGGY